MSAPEFSDEELMAYADGELAEDRAAALDLALAADDALAERLALFTETRAILADALRPMLDDPVPAHLVQRVRDLAAADAAAQAANVVAFPARPQAPPIWQLPIAASIALAVGFGAGLMLRGQADPDAPIQFAGTLDPALTEALDSLASGQSLTLASGARVEAIATFRSDDDAVCREFEYDHAGGTTVVSVVCHDGQDWQTRLAVAAAPADETGYAPASSMEALDAYLTATNAGATLSVEDEAAALSALP
jgi:anti-sigma factor RsiW